MDHQWHYVRDGRSLGPISTSELRQLVARGELRSEDLVWREGMPAWSSVASMRLTPPAAVEPPPVPSSRPTTSRHEMSTRRSRASVNQRVVVWSVVGVVAVFLCVGWAMMSLPRTPSKRDRASAPGGQAAKTNDAGHRVQKRQEAAPSPKTIDDSVLDVRDPHSVKATAGDSTAPKPPTEKANSAVESRPPDVTTSEPPAAESTSMRPSPVTPAKQTLFQIVEIRRSPTFSIQGLETRQSLHYQVLSQLDLERNMESQTTEVIQLVIDTRLIAADDSSRPSFAKALDSLKRQRYSFRINNRGEVIEFTGHKETRTTIPLDFAASAGFQLTSVIDEDGWKELAELTFVVPLEGQRAGEPWKRQMTHDWGALGRWSGITTFTAQPTRDQLVHIAFAREMSYTAPRSDDGGLPFQIRNAAFELQQASGTIEFDSAEQRVSTLR